MGALDRYFGIQAAGSTVGREVLGGLTTFSTMSYIVFVQPTVLATTGMDFGSVLVATCLSAAFACLLMGLYARYPFALAPGMGENFLFAFTICSTFPGGLGFSWQAGLAIVFIAGLLFVGLTVTGLRQRVMAVFPECLQNAIGPAIGLYIAFIGLQWGGVVVDSPTTLVTLGAFDSGPALITIAGFLLIAALMARGVRGGILIGILATCGLGLVSGVIPIPDETAQPGFAVVGQFNFSELIEKWDEALIAIALLFFLDFFDTVGTLVGLSRAGGLVKGDEPLPRAQQAFLSDAIGTCAGALLGTSTVTSYIESATGIATGARTGLAAVVTGVCFLGAIALAPVVHIVGQDVGAAFAGVAPDALHVAMYPAVAPALIFVGFMMIAPLRRVNWDDMTESLPAFLTLTMMAFGFGITEGIALGIIAFAAIKPLAGRPRDVHPIMYAVALLLVLRYAFLV